MLATDYAKALYQTRTSGVQGTSDVRLLKSLRTVLTRRGHEKLLPQIFAEYKKLALGAERLVRHKEVTPEKEQTRILLELYKKLTNA